MLLNYDSLQRLRSLLPDVVQASSKPATERSFLREVNYPASNAKAAFGNPAHARYLLASDRMDDVERSRKSTDVREQMEQYMILRYDGTEQAKAQMVLLQREPAVAFVMNNTQVVTSSTPNDPYFANPGGSATNWQWQWGLSQMNFGPAWDVTRGQAYIGVLDRGLPGTVAGGTTTTAGVLTVHPDLAQNFRQHMLNVLVGSSTTGSANHNVHVSGIIAATQNNKTASITANGGNGVGPSNGAIAGACPECSFVTYPYDLPSQPPITYALVAAQLTAAVDGGMQVINWSGGNPTQIACQDTSTFWTFVPDPVCAALLLATQRGVLVVVSAGNNNNDVSGTPLFSIILNNGPQFPGNLHDGSSRLYSVLPVAGVSPSGARWFTGGSGNSETGTNNASLYGVVGPAEKVVSTFNRGEDHNWQVNCSDSINPLHSGADLSAPRFGNGIGDGVGTCTGTSMSAPHISALAGLMLSVNPRATAEAVRTMIRESGNLYPNPTVALGYGLPNATTAVGKALITNPTRLTPLFSYFSASRADSFYTTVPQMARAAAEGKLLPKGNSASSLNYVASYGGVVTGYSLPPLVVVGPNSAQDGKAEVWLFTTDKNPKSTTVALNPIHRMSWKCGDATPYPPVICNSNPGHSDTVLVVGDPASQSSEVPYFISLGYKVDGIEGFAYPKSQARPLGAVKLMRKYNATLDDHAIFPESKAASMAAQGWIYDTNLTDWLGYVYPNTGAIPVIQ